MLTARIEDIDRILGLEMGADDYMVKPIDFSELEARVRAVLRRRGGEARNVIAMGLVVLLVSLAIAAIDRHLMHYWWSLVLLGVGWNFLFVGGTTLLPSAGSAWRQIKVTEIRVEVLEVEPGGREDQGVGFAEVELLVSKQRKKR